MENLPSGTLEITIVKHTRNSGNSHVKKQLIPTLTNQTYVNLSNINITINNVENGNINTQVTINNSSTVNIEYIFFSAFALDILQFPLLSSPLRISHPKLSLPSDFFFFLRGSSSNIIHSNFPFPSPSTS